jgi:Ser/Thr protein kinase RdoA (MazF antagonist)
MLPHPATIWDLPNVAQVTPMAHGGYNNHLFRVAVDDTSRYVLRVYGNHGSARMIEHELTILLQLQRQKLPFTIPAPEITRRGEMCATVETADGMRVMVLLPFVEGANPETANVALAQSAGAAIALLGAALKKLDTRGLRLPPPYAMLERVHPLVPEPAHALELLGSLVDQTTQQHINAILERVQSDVRKRWGALGAQLTHGDMIPGNLLARKDRVVAVLDFENCGNNPRIMDLAGALDTWLWDAFRDEHRWQRAHALLAGYRSEARITKDEAHALPMLILLRNASVLMHLIGRFTAGLTPYVDVESWLDTMISIDTWLAKNSAQLTALALDA